MARIRKRQTIVGRDSPYHSTVLRFGFTGLLTHPGEGTTPPPASPLQRDQREVMADIETVVCGHEAAIADLKEEIRAFRAMVERITGCDLCRVDAGPPAVTPPDRNEDTEAIADRSK